MDNEIINDTEVETEDEAFDEEVFEDNEIEAENESEEDADFDYDDDGNIIISDEEDKETETASEEEVKSEEKAPEKDAKDVEIENLRRQIAERDAQIKETLKSLGADENEGLAGLERLSAEANDQSLEDYRKKKNERLEQEEALKLLQRLRFEEKTRQDLAAVQKTYPETKDYKTVYDIPNFKKFSEFRDSGLSPEEAYAAANYSAVMAKSSEAASQQVRNLNNTKSHLKSSVPVGSKDTSTTITKKQMAEYRDIFPDMSDKEIIALYKQTIKK
jgi:hypothetical protein